MLLFSGRVLAWSGGIKRTSFVSVCVRSPWRGRGTHPDQNQVQIRSDQPLPENPLRSESGQNQIKIRSKSGQNQVPTRFGPDFDPISIRRRTRFGSDLDPIWVRFGPHLDSTIFADFSREGRDFDLPSVWVLTERSWAPTPQGLRRPQGKVRVWFLLASAH